METSFNRKRKKMGTEKREFLPKNQTELHPFSLGFDDDFRLQ